MEVNTNGRIERAARRDQFFVMATADLSSNGDKVSGELQAERDFFLR
jgi:hypothetical protein